MLVCAAAKQLRNGSTDNRDRRTRIEEEAFIWNALLTTLVLLADMRHPEGAPLDLPTGSDGTTRNDLLGRLADGVGGLSSSEIIRGVCPTPRTPLPVRTHYNLACFWNHLRDQAKEPEQKNRYQERALYHLQHGVRDRRHARWANDDNDLATLKKDLEEWWATNVKSLAG